MTRNEVRVMTGWEFTLEEPEDKNFQPINLPHDWAINAPINKDMKQGAAQGYLDRWGIGWYRKKLLISEIKEKAVYYLAFDGIYENSTIWVNGSEAGGRKYGYSSFEIDITNYVQEGENLILVKVDNTAFPADRWYSGAGIYRTVRLLELNKNHLNPYEIQVTSTIKDDTAIVSIKTGKDDLVKATISNGNIKITGESDDDKSHDGEIIIEIADVKLWSPDTPNLYNLELLLIEDGQTIDRYEMNIGVRAIEMVPNKGMFINGKETKIKGICIHQDLGSLGIAAPIEMWRERLLKVKAIGCNTIRTAHHIPAKEILDICDELGLLVYEEPFDKWTGGSYGRYFETEWQRDIETMVKRDRNHPCIFMWGLGNEVENQGQKSMLKLLKMMKDYLLTLDDTRPITYAMNPHFKYESNVDVSKIEDIQKFVDEVSDMDIEDLDERIERIARIAEYVDVISCNYQEQWYTKIHEAIPDKLILGSETYQYFRGHENKMKNMSEDVPWMDVENHDYVIGGILWTGIDYLGESMGYPSKGWSASLFYTNNERKPMSYLYESYWSDKPMVYFSVLDYSQPEEYIKDHWDAPRYAGHWHFPQFQKSIVPYMIASNCQEVTLECNGESYYIKKPQEYPNRMITGYLPYEAGTVTVRGYIDGEEVAKYELKTPGPATRLEFVNYQDNKGLELTAEEGYSKLFTVVAKDKDKTPVMRESGKVTFSISGPAEIIAVDNGDLSSSKPYNANQRHMYLGKASVVIRLTGEKGKVVLLASSSGMDKGQLTINVN